jgi:hypothetical protein
MNRYEAPRMNKGYVT